MDKLHRRVLVLVETCRAMTKIPKRFRPPVDKVAVATIIELLNAAREQNPNDASLIELNAQEAGFSWWSVRYLMDSISRSLWRNSIERRAAKR